MSTNLKNAVISMRKTIIIRYSMPFVAKMSVIFLFGGQREGEYHP
jgi:hypothetical protein